MLWYLNGVQYAVPYSFPANLIVSQLGRPVNVTDINYSPGVPQIPVKEGELVVQNFLILGAETAEQLPGPDYMIRWSL